MAAKHLFTLSLAAELLCWAFGLVLFLIARRRFAFFLFAYMCLILLGEWILSSRQGFANKYQVISAILILESVGLLGLVRHFKTYDIKLVRAANVFLVVNIVAVVGLWLFEILNNVTVYWFMAVHFGGLLLCASAALYNRYIDVQAVKGATFDYQFVIWSCILIYAPLQMVRVMLVPFFIEYYSITHFSLGRLITNIACVFLYGGLALAAYLQYRQSKTAKAA